MKYPKQKFILKKVNYVLLKNPRKRLSLLLLLLLLTKLELEMVELLDKSWDIFADEHFQKIIQSRTSFGFYLIYLNLLGG